MQQINLQYSNKEHLKQTLLSHNIDLTSEKILIQVFTSEFDKKKVEFFLNDILEVLPNSVVIGSSSGGTILNGIMEDQNTTLSISYFTSSQIYAASVEGSDSKKLGQTLMQKLSREDAKCYMNKTFLSLNKQELKDLLYELID